MLFLALMSCFVKLSRSEHCSLRKMNKYKTEKASKIAWNISLLRSYPDHPRSCWPWLSSWATLWASFSELRTKCFSLTTSRRTCEVCLSPCPHRRPLLLWISKKKKLTEFVKFMAPKSHFYKVSTDQKEDFVPEVCIFAGCLFKAHWCYTTQCWVEVSFCPAENQYLFKVRNSKGMRKWVSLLFY